MLERRAPKHLALKASGAYVPESQSTVGNGYSTVTGHTQNITCSRTQGRSSHLKDPGSDPLADLWMLPEKAGGYRRSPWDTDTSDSHLGSVLYHGHWCWQESLWSTPSSSSALGLTSTDQPVGRSSRTPTFLWAQVPGPTQQLARWGQNPSHQQAGCLKTLWDHSHLRIHPSPVGPGPGPLHQHQSCHQRLWYSILPTGDR